MSMDQGLGTMINSFANAYLQGQGRHYQQRQEALAHKEYEDDRALQLKRQAAVDSEQQTNHDFLNRPSGIPGYTMGQLPYYEQILTAQNATAAATHRAQKIDPQVAASLGIPADTTYGDLGDAIKLHTLDTDAKKAAAARAVPGQIAAMQAPVTTPEQPLPDVVTPGAPLPDVMTPAPPTAGPQTPNWLNTMGVPLSMTPPMMSAPQLGPTQPTVTPGGMSAPVTTIPPLDINKLRAMRSQALAEGNTAAVNAIDVHLAPLEQKEKARANKPDLAAKGYVKPIFKDPKTGEDIDLTKTYGDYVSAGAYKDIGTQRGLFPTTKAPVQPKTADIERSFTMPPTTWLATNVPQNTPEARKQTLGFLQAAAKQYGGDSPELWQQEVSKELTKQDGAFGPTAAKTAFNEANTAKLTSARIAKMAQDTVEIGERNRQAWARIQQGAERIAKQGNGKKQVITSDGMTVDQVERYAGEQVKTVNSLLHQQDLILKKYPIGKIHKVRPPMSPEDETTYKSLSEQIGIAGKNRERADKILDSAFNPVTAPVSGGEKAGTIPATDRRVVNVKKAISMGKNRQQIHDSLVQGGVKEDEIIAVLRAAGVK